MSAALKAQQAPAPPRRIDVTLERLRATFETLSPEQQQRLGTQKSWAVVVMVDRLRSMERAEEDVLQRPISPMADAYDSIVTPGEHPIEAIVRTFQAVYAAPLEHS